MVLYGNTKIITMIKNKFMKTTINNQKQPTANICINKSRVKIYNTKELPTIYLEKATTFQIELFNPTTDVVLAKIILNGKSISQGGLVLNPGQRVFLERYLDVAKKFLFDTYEVSNTAEVKEAIVNNGDFKVEFYREKPHIVTNTLTYTSGRGSTINLGNYHSGTTPIDLRGSCTTQSIGGSSSLYSSSVPTSFYNTGIGGVQSFPPVPEQEMKSFSKKLRSKTSKSIETGRVEKGSSSDQKVVTVDKTFEYMAFHTIECKMLPISQKVNTVEDVQVKVYCTNCGSKLGKTDRFCASCGTKK